MAYLTDDEKKLADIYRGLHGGVCSLFENETEKVQFLYELLKDTSKDAAYINALCDLMGLSDMIGELENEMQENKSNWEEMWEAGWDNIEKG